MHHLQLPLTLGMVNIEDSQLGHIGILLQQQGHGLANATCATQHCDLVRLLLAEENFVNFSSNLLSSPSFTNFPTCKPNITDSTVELQYAHSYAEGGQDIN